MFVQHPTPRPTRPRRELGSFCVFAPHPPPPGLVPPSNWVRFARLASAWNGGHFGRRLALFRTIGSSRDPACLSGVANWVCFAHSVLAPRRKARKENRNDNLVEPWRSWRLCARHNSLTPSDLRCRPQRAFARKRDSETENETKAHLPGRLWGVGLQLGTPAQVSCFRFQIVNHNSQTCHCEPVRLRSGQAARGNHKSERRPST